MLRIVSGTGPDADVYAAVLRQAAHDAVRAVLAAPPDSVMASAALRGVTAWLARTYGPAAVQDLAEELAVDLAERSTRSPPPRGATPARRGFHDQPQPEVRGRRGAGPAGPAPRTLTSICGVGCFARHGVTTAGYAPEIRAASCGLAPRDLPTRADIRRFGQTSPTRRFRARRRRRFVHAMNETMVIVPVACILDAGRRHGRHRRSRRSSKGCREHSNHKFAR
jgi:hypothetical protein